VIEAEGHDPPRRRSTDLPRWVVVAAYIIHDVGFPIAVTAYLLWRDFVMMREQTSVLWSLYQVVQRLAETK
jgi:hypothetical protein